MTPNAKQLLGCICRNIAQSNEIWPDQPTKLADVTFVRLEFKGDYKTALAELIEKDIVRQSSPEYLELQ